MANEIKSDAKYQLVKTPKRPPVMQGEVKSALKYGFEKGMLAAKGSLNLVARKQGKKGGKARATRAPSLPKELDSVFACTHTFRFQVTTGFTALQNITGGNLAGAIGGYVTVVNSTLSRIASSIRINRITVWPPAQNVGALSLSPEIVWFSAITVMEKDESKERILPSGITVTAPLNETPPKNTLCGDWWAVSSANTQPMFGLINMASGAIVDVNMSFTITNNLVGGTSTVATGILGTYYYLYLDGSSSHQIQPIGKPTTF